MEFKDVLRGLIDESGLTQKEIAVATRITYSTLISYLNGAEPSIGNLVKLCEYFAVPMDVMYGRVSKEDYVAIREDYKKNMMKLCRVQYEEFFIRRKKEFRQNPGFEYEPPYPYNVYEAVTGVQCGNLLSDDDERWIDDTVKNACDDTAYRYFVSYFRDNASYQDIKQLYGENENKIRQVIYKTLRKLRTPDNLCRLERGKKGYYEIIAANNALNDRQRLLDEREKELDRKEEQLMQMQGALQKTVNQFGRKQVSEMCIPVVDPRNDVIEDVGFSARTYNCLKRSGINDMATLAKVAKTGTLSAIRNMGAKSLDETYSMVKRYTGIDYSDVAVPVKSFELRDMLQKTLDELGCRYIM